MIKSQTRSRFGEEKERAGIWRKFTQRRRRLNSFLILSISKANYHYSSFYFFLLSPLTRFSGFLEKRTTRKRQLVNQDQGYEIWYNGHWGLKKVGERGKERKGEWIHIPSIFFWQSICHSKVQSSFTLSLCMFLPSFLTFLNSKFKEQNLITQVWISKRGKGERERDLLHGRISFEALKFITFTFSSLFLSHYFWNRFIAVPLIIECNLCLRFTTDCFVFHSSPLPSFYHCLHVIFSLHDWMKNDEVFNAFPMR